MTPLAISAIVMCVVACLAIVLFQSWFHNQLMERAEFRHSSERSEILHDAKIAIQKKDERIVQLDADYKALAESYIRETGKVYIRPATSMETNNLKLPPAQPNPWKMKPAPPWAPTDTQRREKGNL